MKQTLLHLVAVGLTLGAGREVARGGKIARRGGAPPLHSSSGSLFDCLEFIVARGGGSHTRLRHRDIARADKLSKTLARRRPGQHFG